MKEDDIDKMGMDQVAKLLNPKQRVFAETYAITLDTRASMEAAGYKNKNPLSYASDLLKQHKVMRYVELMQKELTQHVKMDAKQVISEYAKLASVNVKDFFDENGEVIPLHKLPRRVSAAIQEVKKEVTGYDKASGLPVYKWAYKIHPKHASLQDLGKHYGIFEKNNEQKPKGQVVLYLPENNRTKK